MAKGQGKVGMAKSATVAAVPLACSDEDAAVLFFEARLWKDAPRCPHCQSTEVARIMSKAGTHGPRYLWRCHAKGCKKQFTVRVGSVLEDSRIPLRHWAYAFWAACASKKGVSALQIQRQTGLSYKSALFLMHRIRFAMADGGNSPKLSGMIEADHTYIGGKPRFRNRKNIGTYQNRKPAVFAIVQRDGNVHAEPMVKVTSAVLRSAFEKHVDATVSTLMTDEAPMFAKIGSQFSGGHFTTEHSWGEYVKPGGIHSNTVESFFSLLKRGVYGTFHSVSKKHLHRYVSEFAFRYNTRKVDDGARLDSAIAAAQGKKLFYKKVVNG